jgi:hypothetical protein
MHQANLADIEEVSVRSTSEIVNYFTLLQTGERMEYAEHALNI